MQKPYLTIFAGCNGAGKSTYSISYSKGIVPFDYDKRRMEIYSSMEDSELRDLIAKNLTTKEFESSIKTAFNNGDSFCYETNFNDQPMAWASQAKKLGYHLELYFFCLESIELAQKRVYHRYNVMKGHFIHDDVIKDKWKEGYKNLNLNYSYFDSVLLVDNSSDSTPPKNLFTLFKNDRDGFDVEFYDNEIPEYAERRFPDIYKIITEYSDN